MDQWELFVSAISAQPFPTFRSEMLTVRKKKKKTKKNKLKCVSAPPAVTVGELMEPSRRDVESVDAVVFLDQRSYSPASAE